MAEAFSEKALIAALTPLGDYLNEVVVCRSWTLFIYRRWVLKSATAAPVRTLDVDLAVPKKLPLLKDPLDKQLKAAGFKEELLGGAPPIIHFHLPSAPYLEFITPYQELLDLKARERQDADCPRILGIDEHFFTKKDGYATTLCDLGKHRVFDVMLGRSEKALERPLGQLLGKDQVRVVCMDLSSTYRSIVRKHFPKALIVADRFHVIRLVNHHFQATWAILDPKGRTNRGLLSLMRRHEHKLRPEQRSSLNSYLQKLPALEAVYAFKQRLCRLLSIKHRTARQCRRLVPIFLGMIRQLKTSGFAPMAQLGQTLDSWKDEVARMWRFTKNNGITEGFHTKMEMISRRAFGFRNFENYRLRVRVLCG